MEFLVPESDIEAIESSGRFGISADQAANDHSGREETRLIQEVLAETDSSMCCSSPIGADRKKRIEEAPKNAERRTDKIL